VAAVDVLDRIRALTSQPAKDLVHSHWRWDGWYSAKAYRSDASETGHPQP